MSRSADPAGYDRFLNEIVSSGADRSLGLDQLFAMILAH